MSHLDPDLLVLAALEDETAVDVDDHLSTCAVCRAEVEKLRTVVSIGRETAQVVDLPPAPEHVWHAIAAEAFDHPAAGQAVERPAAVPTRAASPATRWWRNWRVGLVAATAALVAVFATLFVTRAPQPPQVLSTAELSVQDPAASGASGQAELLASGQLRVTLRGMPTPAGYYEVWLYDGHQRMIGLGDAGSGNGSVTVSVPSTANLDEFTIVDISAQQLGQQEHGQSMLQGQLRP